MNYHKLISELFYSTNPCNRSLAFELAKSTHCYEQMVEGFYTSLLEIPSFKVLVSNYDPSTSEDILSEVVTEEAAIKQLCVEQFCDLYFHKKMNLNGYQLSAHTTESLQTFPRILWQCVFLEELDLSHNQLEKLPEEIGHLHNLKKLNLSSNASLKALPSSLGKLKKLEKLNLSGIFDLFKVEIAGQGLHYSFPACLRGLTNLRHLNLQDVMLDALPSWINEWESLESLHLFSGNRRYPNLTLPPSFFELQQLHTLTIDAFTVAIPEEIQQLSTLKSLVVNKAKFTSAGIAQLPQLKYLDLSYLSPDFPLYHPSYTTLQDLPKEDRTSRLSLFGWEWLLEMPQLEELVYKHKPAYRLTTEDEELLRKALPNCTFSFQ